LTILADFGPHF